MIRRIFCALAALLLLMQPGRAEPFDYLVRLHVVAADDTPEAQAFKLEIRDAVLERARELLAGCADADEAWAALNDHLSEFLTAAEERAKALGHDEKLSAQAGVFAFPDRTYGSVTVPAGDYRALRIIIGDGKGQNWWCVLFPSLCLPAEGEYHSLLGDWLSGLFGGEHS